MPRRNRNAYYRSNKPDWSKYDGSIFPLSELEFSELTIGSSKLKVKPEEIVRDFRESMMDYSGNDKEGYDFKKFILLTALFSIGFCALFLLFGVLVFR